MSNERTRRSGLKLCQGLLEKKKITERVVRHWNKLPRKVEVSLSLEVLKRHLDMVLDLEDHMVVLG